MPNLTADPDHVVIPTFVSTVVVHVPASPAAVLTVKVFSLEMPETIK
jgi:hypothetical protein